MGIMFMNKLIFDVSCTNRGQDSILKLTLSENQTGIIYKVTAVLFAYGWDIKEANFEILDGIIKDVFVIRNANQRSMCDFDLQNIKNDLNELFFQDITVIDYLERFPNLRMTTGSPTPPIVHVFNPKSVDSTVLDIRTTDRPGLLFEISQLLYILDVDILSVIARTDEGFVRDSFLLRKNECDRLDDETMEKVKEGLLKLL
jgi:[protein-PII] uridylyltransferase